MKKKTQKYILENQLFTKEDKILVAVSGGIDSMLLLTFLYELGYQIGVAHVNYGKRGADSDADETFVSEWAAARNVPFWVRKYEEKNGVLRGGSFQARARNFRYEWFENLCQTFDYQYIATAHHADDNTETALMNLARGTGLRGLVAMLPKQGRVVRPLLWAQKSLLLATAALQKIAFRHDVSNDTNDYDRNFVRHEIVPKLTHLNANFLETMFQNQQYFNESQHFIDYFLQPIVNELITVKNEFLTIIKTSTLDNYPAPRLILFECLKKFNFKNLQIDKIFDALKSQTASGKRFDSETHQLFLHHKDLEIYTKNALTEGGNFLPQNIDLSDIQPHQPIKIGDLIFSLENLQAENFVFPFKKDKNFAYFDFEKLNFPMTIRTARQGDTFQPLGMNGKSKKVSDFFTQTKFSFLQKNNQKILIHKNETEILWIIGQRSDERCRVGEGTRWVLCVEKT